jgi:hypothetical protein
MPGTRRRDLLAQHRLLQHAQLLTRLQPQFTGKDLPRPPVRGQRVGLPLGPVQRQHQQPPQPLPQMQEREDAVGGQIRTMREALNAEQAHKRLETARRSGDPDLIEHMKAGFRDEQLGVFNAADASAKQSMTWSRAR